MKHFARNLFFVAIVLAVFAGAWYVLRTTLKHEIRTAPQFRLDASKIFVPQRPPWIADRFVEEVLFLASLDGCESVLDRNLPEKLAVAFSANPWVRRVDRVRIRYPAEVFVDLEYRVPCCMVDVPARDGYSPVDPEGILLPTEYFTHVAPEALGDYPVVVGIQSNPIGRHFGEPWGDRAVEGAARIAFVLGPEAVRFGIEKIRVLPVRTTAPDGSFVHDSELLPRYELVSADGRSIFWGSYDDENAVAGYDLLTEAAKHSPEVKKRNDLYEQLKQYGSLDRLPDSFGLAEE